ncbi:MAG: sigma-70 family RNA polymerase sigma factor [Chloroflexi bacterium]|nr:sigma-70 family RNA polymerase sigma factor [Chloroflexota bacterium]
MARVADPWDVEDILRDVFSELVEANRRLMPIDDVAAWLFRVARNRITDLFRKMQPDSFSARASSRWPCGLSRCSGSWRCAGSCSADLGTRPEIAPSCVVARLSLGNA